MRVLMDGQTDRQTLPNVLSPCYVVDKKGTIAGCRIVPQVLCRVGAYNMLTKNKVCLNTPMYVISSSLLYESV